MSLSTWYWNINGCCKAIQVDQNITCICFKPQWVDARVNNFLIMDARELKFCVFSLGEIPIGPLQANLVIKWIMAEGGGSANMDKKIP